MFWGSIVKFACCRREWKKKTFYYAGIFRDYWAVIFFFVVLSVNSTFEKSENMLPCHHFTLVFSQLGQTNTVYNESYYLQRVIDENSTSSISTGVASLPPTTTNSSFNYLYEYSETRKVLEEFFKPDEVPEKSHQFRVSIFFSNFLFRAFIFEECSLLRSWNR